MSGPSTTVSVGGDYDVVIGHDLLASVGAMLLPSVERVLVVHSAAFPGPARAVAEALGVDHEVRLAAVPDAEAAKTAETASVLWAELGQAGFTRSDAVVGVGGGTVTDLAGFVAATWLRGVAVVQVPTTLLAMVDAAVGGKTGINTAEGKNLVGSFHPPAGSCATSTCSRRSPPTTTSPGSRRSSRPASSPTPPILDLVEADPEGARRWDGPSTNELVERAIAVKAEVVSKDLTESWLREILNYGHTLGHAIEQAEGYTRRHGEAVAIGMVYAAELGVRAAGLPPEVRDRHRAVLEAVGLPTAYPGGRLEHLLVAMRRDKKTRGSLLRFVVLEDLARPARLEGPDEELLRAAYAAIAAD